jgi:hypothetical protein
MDTAGVDIGSLKNVAEAITAAAAPWPIAAVLRAVVELHGEQQERTTAVLFLTQWVVAPTQGTHLLRGQTLHMQHLVQPLHTPMYPIHPHLKAVAEVMVAVADMRAAADMRAVDMKAADTSS